MTVLHAHAYITMVCRRRIHLRDRNKYIYELNISISIKHKWPAYTIQYYVYSLHSNSINILQVTVLLN